MFRITKACAILLFIQSIIYSVDLAIQEGDLPKSNREIIQEINKASIIEENDSFNSWTYYDFLRQYIEYQVKPTQKERRKCAFAATKTTTHAAQTIIKETTTWSDLMLFAGKKAGDNYCAQNLCNTATELGKTQFYGILGSTSNEIKEIKRRQDIIKHLIEKKQIKTRTQDFLKEAAAKENLLLSFYTESDSFLQNLTRNYFFEDDLLKYLNNSQASIWTKYGWEVMNKFNALISEGAYLNTLVTFLLAYCIPSGFGEENIERIDYAVANQFYNNKLRSVIWRYGTQAVKAVLVALSTYFSVVYLNKTITYFVDDLYFEDILQLKMAHVATFFKAMFSTHVIIEQDATLCTLLPELKDLKTLFNTTKDQDAELYYFIQLMLHDSNFREGKNAIFANKGKIMIAYKSMHELKDKLKKALQAFSLFDAYCGVAKTIESNPESFCFVELEEGKTPHILLKDFINPLLPLEKAIPNSIELGSQGPSRNCIITGPNAGGKSTLIKAIGLNVLIAQSLGIAAAKRCVLTPYSFVATYLNITDDINAGNSLFEAEVLRTDELIETLLCLRKKEFGLLIFDEIFNGTTPREGSAAAFAVAEHLGKIKNGTIILATHFEDVTNLEKIPECGYKNYKVTAKINADKSISYPFKIESGIANQHIALDVLHSKGYESSIINRASELLK